jgi:hypothetical protein
MTKRKTAGRPAGRKERIAIDLPDGDRLVPYYSTFSQTTGLNAKYLQRIRPRMPTVEHGGIVYVRDAAGRRVLAEPKKPRGGRR